MIGSYLWSWQWQQLSVRPRNALRGVLDVVAHPVVVVPPEEVADEEAGGDEVVVVRRGEFVGREHLPHHLVVAAVLVERPDDPVAPPPDLAVAVQHVGHRPPAVPVAVPPDVHPVPAPALAVLRRGEQPIDHLLVGVRRGVVRGRRAVPRASAAGR